MKCPEELLLVQFESEDAVISGGGDIEAASIDAHLVGVLQIRTTPRPDEFEIRRKSKKHVTCQHIDGLVVDGDAAEATVPITPPPLSISRDEVHDLVHILLFQVDDIDPAMASALFAATDD
jgi:hypothetical protein